MLKNRILILEDDQKMRESIAAIREREEFWVNTAVDGYDDLEKLTQGLQPGWILLDFTMSQMNSFEWGDALRKHTDWKSITVTLVSAPKRLKEKPMEKNAGYLAKPFKREALMSKARKHCRRLPVSKQRVPGI